jgi:hypothetical protein
VRTILYVLVIWAVAIVPLALLAGRICSLNRRYEPTPEAMHVRDQAA